MSGGRIALLVVGIVVALISLAALGGGVALLVANHTERDGSGYFTSGAKTYETDGYALVSDDLDIGMDGPQWLFEKGHLATLRIRASSKAGRDVFIGIAPASRVKAYLARTKHAVVTDVDFDPFRVTYRPTAGDARPAAPTTKAFWSSSAQGPGRQSVEWKVAKGNWAAVVMNADASDGVGVRLSVGAKIGLIFWVGLGLTIAGAVLLAGAAALLYLALRRRRPSLPAPPISQAG